MRFEEKAFDRSVGKQEEAPFGVVDQALAGTSVEVELVSDKRQRFEGQVRISKPLIYTALQNSEISESRREARVPRVLVQLETKGVRSCPPRPAPLSTPLLSAA